MAKRHCIIASKSCICTTCIHGNIKSGSNRVCCKDQRQLMNASARTVCPVLGCVYYRRRYIVAVPVFDLGDRKELFNA